MNVQALIKQTTRECILCKQIVFYIYLGIKNGRSQGLDFNGDKWRGGVCPPCNTARKTKWARDNKEHVKIQRILRENENG